MVGAARAAGGVRDDPRHLAATIYRREQPRTPAASAASRGRTPASRVHARVVGGTVRNSGRRARTVSLQSTARVFVPAPLIHHEPVPTIRVWLRLRRSDRIVLRSRYSWIAIPTRDTCTPNS